MNYPLIIINGQLDGNYGVFYLFVSIVASRRDAVY